MIAIWLAFVLVVGDGDTFRARVTLWPGQSLETAIRIHGIDTPELRGQCEQERTLAVQAQQLTEQLIARRTVQLSHVKHDKYGGRYLATVKNADGVDIGQVLIERGLAVPYTGRGPKRDWCQEVEK